MSIQVIGSGYGRTGTLSLKMALEKLGVGPCYHMLELFKNTSGIKYWEQALHKQQVDWNSLFTDYQSIVDFPGAIYFEELAKFYPDAKVIHTVRDPESWYESAMATIFSFNPPLSKKLKILFTLPFSSRSREFMRIIKMNNTVIWDHQFEKKFADKNYTIENFKKHTQRVKDTIPADRLLIYQVKEGWEPLCNFLGKDIPDEPFPRSNKREEFTELVKNLI